MDTAQNDRQICFLLMSYGSSGKTESYGTIEEGGESMSLEAIQKVTEIEKLMQERKIAADTEARQIISDAEKAGILKLQNVREEAVAHGRTYLQEAEKQAEAKAAEIQSIVAAESDVLRQTAEKHLDEAAELIVRRVVNR
jgi:vacuolar-type H+-ATPase subunit H